MDSNTNEIKVVVSGSVLYETDDELIAGAVAHSYRSIGWQNVEVKHEVSE